MYRKTLTLGLMITAIFMMSSIANGQWPDDAVSNMIISNHSGAQAIPLVEPTSDGGCYVCWYDNTTGNYNLYLQRLNHLGEIQWQENGILISGHPQETWLTMYDMAVDQDDYAIIVINDIRSGGDWDIYAYKIGPNGEFYWGDDGITISDNDDFEPVPKVTVTSNNNVVVSWLTEDAVNLQTVVNLRKLTPSGADFWSDPNIITISTEYGLSWPHITSSNNDAVILQALIHTGPNYWDDKDIYMFKFDEFGDSPWGEGGALVSNAGGFGIFMYPLIKDDGDGGAFSYWYDDRVSFQFNAYVQHINSNGNAVWEANGILLSLSDTREQMGPSLAYFPESGNVMVFYVTSNHGQSRLGIGGQMLNAMGQRMWGEDGIDFVPLGNYSRSHVQAHAFENDAMVVAFDSPVGDVLNRYVDAMRINPDGILVWDGLYVRMSSCLSEKLHLASAITTNGQAVAVWEDRRYGAADIYLQNVNPNGTLGIMVSVDDNDGIMPAQFKLGAAYPNPFNASTTISYSISTPGYMKLDIYDILGCKVKTLVEGEQAAGEHQISWNASDVSSGIYFVKLQAGNFTESRKLVLLK